MGPLLCLGAVGGSHSLANLQAAHGAHQVYSTGDEMGQIKRRMRCGRKNGGQNEVCRRSTAACMYANPETMYCIPKLSKERR